MSIDKFLEDLAVESGLIEPEVQEVVTDTAADVIVEQQADEQPEALLEQAEKARDLADELEDLAEQADKIASADDEKYSAESIEFLAREYAVLTRVRGVKYKPYSFESEVNPQAKAIGIATDARRAAEHLRTNANVIDNLSNEGRLWDALTSKDAKLKKAITVLNREVAIVKAKSGALNKEGVIVKNRQAVLFLRAKGEFCKDIAAQIDVETSHIDDCMKYVEERMSYLGSLKVDSTSKLGKESQVNTLPTSSTLKGRVTDKVNINEYKLLGNYAVGDFKLIDQANYGIKMSVAVGMPISAAAGFVVGSLVATPIGAMLGGAAVGLTVGQVMEKKIDSNLETKSLTHYPLASLEKFAKGVAGLMKYSDTNTTYRNLEELQVTLKDTLAKENKELYKHAKEELVKVTKTIDIVKTRTFYLATETARFMEQVNRAVK